MKTSVGDVSIRLGRDEALVLFEWLHRCENQDSLSPLEHQDKQVALRNLSALLERELVEPFQPGYRQMVDEARERLAEPESGMSDALSVSADQEARTHSWQIEDREYARQESRRGRRHAFENVVPSRTALVVIDMVPFFVSENPYCRGIVPNISRLATSLRKAGGLVAWVVPAAGQPSAAAQEFFGADVAAMYASSGGEGPPEQRLWSDFEVYPGDVLVEKSLSSAFFPGSSPLPSLLAEHGIDTVLITGTLTNICCESSARDASALQLRVIMVADANAARRDQDHNAALYNVYRTFGDVRTTTEVLDLIKVS